MREAELGKPRAAACVARLGQLNPHVRVTVVDGALDAAAVAGHDVLVCTQAPTARQLELNAICRAHGVKFLAAGIHGVFSRVFADFGDEHAVTDADGEPPAVSMVASVSADSPPLVTVTDQARHGLQTGSKVVFTEVQGMDRLTSGEVFEVEEKGPFTFTLKGVEGASLGAYGSGGYVKEVKEGKVMRFRALEEAIRQPGEFLESDFGKFGRPLLLHIAFLALDRWSGDNGGKLPHSGSRADADAVAAAAAALNGERQREGLPCVEAWGDAENAIARWLALTARGEISPMAAAIGGFVAQEALKVSAERGNSGHPPPGCPQAMWRSHSSPPLFPAQGVSGKFTPLHQWFYFDEVECLPAEPLAEAEYAPRGSRYDGQAAVFGWTMQQQVLAQRYFLVGAGAIGCEMLKNWALMGVGCGPEGQVTVTDMDRIEKSNLSRQFLFRASDIGEPKSATAAAAVREMNGDMRLRPMEQRVGTATEAVFNDDFFDALTGVCTALDNVEARMYMDQRCLFYSKPMLESGTLGTKGNTQVVVPHVTENYGASRDPPEKSIPLCTLKNFPHKIEHTIQVRRPHPLLPPPPPRPLAHLRLQWARDWFEGAFKQTPEDANTHLRSGEDFATLLQQQASSAVYTLERVEKALGEDRPISLEHCVQWARRQFEHLFHNIIVQLLHTFPPEHTTAEGQPFWAGEKRMPSPVSFDPSDETHVDFIEAAANLHAFNYGIRGTRDRAFLRRVAAETEVEAFQPSSGVKIAATDEEAKREAERKQQQAATGIDDTIRDKMARLPAPADMAGYQLVRRPPPAATAMTTDPLSLSLFLCVLPGPR